MDNQPPSNPHGKPASIDIDTGINIVTITAEMFKGKKVFTAYLNNISIRSSSMHMPRLQDNFIDCIECAAGCADETFALSDECVLKISDFIVDNLTW